MLKDQQSFHRDAIFLLDFTRNVFCLRRTSIEIIAGYTSSKVNQSHMTQCSQACEAKIAGWCTEMVERIKETLSTKIKMSANELSANAEPKEMFLP